MNRDVLTKALAQQSVNDADTAAWLLDQNPEDVCESRMPWEELCNTAYNLAAGFTTLHNAVKSVLSEPLRNCDRFDGDIDKLREACMLERGLNPEEDFPEVFCEWLLARAKGEAK